MSITDELREWMRDHTVNCSDNRIALVAIANRIDAEHERAVMSAMNDALYHANNDSMAELGWVRLPKDADGECIHIGDVMAYMDNTKPMEVMALVPPAVFLTEDGPRYANMCRHYHAPTVEDVLREMLCAWEDTLTSEGVDGIIAEYAAKLRLAEGEDA